MQSDCSKEVMLQAHQVIEFHVIDMATTDRALVDMGRTGSTFHMEDSTLCTHFKVRFEHTSRF